MFFIQSLPKINKYLKWYDAKIYHCLVYNKKTKNNIIIMDIYLYFSLNKIKEHDNNINDNKYSTQSKWNLPPK